MPERPGLFVGASGWNYFDWEGRFYPEGLRLSEYLPFPAHHFRTTEVNHSFCHLPKVTIYGKWGSQATSTTTSAAARSQTR